MGQSRIFVSQNTHRMYFVQSDGYSNFVVCKGAHFGSFGHKPIVVLGNVVVGVVVVGVVAVGVVAVGVVAVGVVVVDAVVEDVTVVVDGMVVVDNTVVEDGVAVVEVVVEIPLQLGHSASAGSMHSATTGLNSCPLGHCIILENPITH